MLLKKGWRAHECECPCGADASKVAALHTCAVWSDGDAVAKDRHICVCLGWQVNTGGARHIRVWRGFAWVMADEDSHTMVWNDTSSDEGAMSGGVGRQGSHKYS